MKLLLQTTDPTVIAFAQALLEGEDIASFVLDVHMSVFEGSIGILPLQHHQPARDWVEARSVIRANGIDEGYDAEP